MNKEFKYLMRTLLFIAILLIVSIRFSSNNDFSVVQGSKENQVKQITSKDVVGVWINHHNKDIHQKITFTKNHQWR